MSFARTTILAALFSLAWGCSSPPPATSSSTTSTTGGKTATPDPKGETPPVKAGPEGAKPNEKPVPEDPNLGKVSGGTGQSYLLRLNVPAGFKRTYTFTVDTFIDPRALKADDPARKTAPEYSTLKLVGEMLVSATSVNNGRWSFINSPKVLSAVGTGSWKQQADDMLKTAPEAQKYIWDERMRNVNIDKEEYADPLTNTLNGVLPKDPVMVGSTWSYKPFPKATVLSKVKVEKVETISGIETLKLNIDTPSATEGEKSVFLVWIEPKTGFYVRTELHIGGSQKGLVSKNDFVQTIKP